MELRRVYKYQNPRYNLYGNYLFAIVHITCYVVPSNLFTSFFISENKNMQLKIKPYKKMFTSVLINNKMWAVGCGQLDIPHRDCKYDKNSEYNLVTSLL